MAQLAKKDYLGKATVGGVTHLPTSPVPWTAWGPGGRDSRRHVPAVAFRDDNEDLADSKEGTLPVSSVILVLSNSRGSSQDAESQD